VRSRSSPPRPVSFTSPLSCDAGEVPEAPAGLLMPEADDRPEVSPAEEAVPEVSEPVSNGGETGLLAEGVPPEELSEVSAAEEPGDVTERPAGLPGLLAEGVPPE